MIVIITSKHTCFRTARATLISLSLNSNLFVGVYIKHNELKKLIIRNFFDQLTKAFKHTKHVSY